MVMSVGYNPFYKNTVRSAVGSCMSWLILGSTYHEEVRTRLLWERDEGDSPWIYPTGVQLHLNRYPP